jgi:hypothetical protein
MHDHMTLTISRDPWNCQWGRCVVAIENLGGGDARVDAVAWACHDPSRTSGLRIIARAECQRCPSWIEPLRLRAQA